jgi:hypothetical protein
MLSYFNTWIKIIFQPILFYTFCPSQDWREEPLTFAAINSWILSFFATILVFINQYVPMGATLIEGISGLKSLLIFPVLLMVAFMFFSMTFFIIGGVFLGSVLVLYYLLSFVTFWINRIFSKENKIEDFISAFYYSSAAIVFGLFSLLLGIFISKFDLNFSAFLTGYYLTYFLILLYSYGLFAVVVRKVGKVEKWQAFLIALAPTLILFSVGIFAGVFIIPKLSGIIG